MFELKRKYNILKSLLASLCMVSFISNIAFAGDLDKVSEEKLNIEEQYKIISEFNENLKMKRSTTNNIDFIGVKEDGIDISLNDTTDINLKEEILLLPGIDSESVDFVDFNITWQGLADELPENYDIKRGVNYGLGVIIEIDGMYATMGSPASTSANTFYTANHSYVRTGDPVYYRGSRMGTVDRYNFGGYCDVSRVNMSAYDGRIAHALDNLHASTPSQGTRVTAYTGYSGYVSGSILYKSAEIDGSGFVLRDLTVASMQTQQGDSGACLVYNRGAIGILSMGAEVNGSPVTLFTKTTNIPF